jgi:hypothetical protein
MALSMYCQPFMTKMKIQPAMAMMTGHGYQGMEKGRTV